MLCFTFFMPALANPVFTGNASADFTIPGTNLLLPVPGLQDPVARMSACQTRLLPK